MKVCVDPGHGMSNRSKNVFDPGATHQEDGTLFREADIALKYGLQIKDFLRAAQHQVFMTRDDDTDHAPVGQRASNAESAGCERFVSLHLNDFDDDKANGVEVLYRDTEHTKLAQRVLDRLLDITGFKDRGVIQRKDLAVLKFDGPAILVELGFIANDGNRTVLLNPQKREAICKAIAEEIVK